MDFDTRELAGFKKVIEDIIDTRLQRHGITSFISAIVTKVNDDDTVNAVIPPDNKRFVNNLLNKSNESLSVGDSIELCTKNGKLSNAWVAVKHGKSTSNQPPEINIYPVGSIYISVDNTNPSVYFGGTWEAFATGRTLVGIDASQKEFKTAGLTGGSKYLQSHNHYFKTITGNQVYNNVAGDYGGKNIVDFSTLEHNRNAIFSVWPLAGSEFWAKISEPKDVTTGDSGNLQPYIVVYMWKRVA
jgi:hypothetical protein|nr:MAG TPA: baseplate protein [Caudoviricetes sp.]